MKLNSLAERDVMAALQVMPEDMWDVQDDLCDCTYQRIGFWTNPYIAETLEVRMCCIWEELYKLFPGKVRVTKGFFDYNNDEWRTEPQEWDAEYDMPRSIWYRQLARKTGKSVAEIREAYKDQEPPKGIPRPVVEQVSVDPIGVLFEMVQGLADLVGPLIAKVEQLESRS